MNFMYGLAKGNALQTRRFSGRNASDQKIFENIHRRLHETGTLKQSGGPERSRTKGTYNWNNMCWT